MDAMLSGLICLYVLAEGKVDMGGGIKEQRQMCGLTFEPEEDNMR